MHDRTRWGAFFAWVAAAGFAGTARAGEPAAEPTVEEKFFAAFEQGDAPAALAALPAEVRDASPYDAKTEALPIPERDRAIYFSLAERMESKAPVAEAARREAAVQLDLGVLAWRKGDMEAARRKFLLAVSKFPRYRMAHIYLARALRHLEAKALEGIGDKSPGEVLAEKIGAGASDVHVDMATDVVGDDEAAKIPAVVATFRFEDGAVKDPKVERGTASGNARIQRSQVAASEPGHWSVALLAADGVRVAEGWFAPVQTLFIDGMDESGKPTHGREDSTKFDVSLELLALEPGARVAVFDPAGKRMAETAVPAADGK